MSRLARLGVRLKNRLGVGKPTTVALIFTPLQAINLLEYAETTGNAPELILVGKSTNLLNRRGIAEVLEGVDATVVEIEVYSGVPLPDARQDASLAEVLFQLRAVKRPIRMVFGEYRSTLVWRLVRLLDLPGKRVIFVDDGAATLSIDRVVRANDVVPWDLEASAASAFGPGVHKVTTATTTRVGPRASRRRLGRSTRATKLRSMRSSARAGCCGESALRASSYV